MVFREIGLADELGSGIIKLLKYTKAYSRGIPKLIEGDVFRTEIPLNRQQKNVTENVTEKLNPTEQKILKVLKDNPNINQKQLSDKLNVTTMTIKRNINKLKEKGLVERIGSDRQGYWKVNL